MINQNGLIALLLSTVLLSGCGDMKWMVELEEERNWLAYKQIESQERIRGMELTYEEKELIRKDVRKKLYAEKITGILYISVPISAALFGFYVWLKKEYAVVDNNNAARIKIEQLETFKVVFNGSSQADRSRLVNQRDGRLPFLDE